MSGELAVTLSVGDIFVDVVHEYPDLTVHLTLFNATIAKGEPQKPEHNDIRWITPSEIPNYDFRPADEEILVKIMERQNGFISENTIEKLVYKREFFDISVMKIGARLVTTINADGTVIFKEYKPGIRKVESVYKGKCTIAAFNLLCYRIEECISTADRQEFYVDDSYEELKIFHRFGRVQMMDRGLGNEEIDIGRIMHDFFEKDVVEE